MALSPNLSFVLSHVIKMNVKKKIIQQNEAYWLFLKCAFPNTLWFSTIQRTSEISQMTVCYFNLFIFFKTWSNPTLNSLIF